MRRVSGVRTNDSMVDSLKASGFIHSDEVEKVMRRVDRGKYASFNPYFDSPQSIGYNATISAPHMHALALENLLPSLKRVTANEDGGGGGGRALDVGSGSGYLTACLALLLGTGGRVVGVEHIPELVRLAEANVRRDNPALLRDERVRFVVADGRFGFPSEAPFDVIHVGAAATEMPPELERQLAVGGRMVVPVGSPGMQTLKVVVRGEDGSLRRLSKMLVAFVPLTDAPAQWSGASAAPRPPPATDAVDDSAAAPGARRTSRISSDAGSRRQSRQKKKPKASPRSAQLEKKDDSDD